MDTFYLISLLALVFVGIPILIGFLLYFIPKKLGYPKLGKYLTFGFGCIIILFVLAEVFGDQLFTKNAAKKLIEEQEILLNDNFELTHNKSMSGIGDYYHTFTLIISDNDEKNAIEKIKKSVDFKKINEPIKDLLFENRNNYYFGEKQTQNYETENSFVREYFKPSGKENYAPTFRRIIIYKGENKLVFEDIDL
jgi:hypothetical protein